jgi:hypothetical protein
MAWRLRDGATVGIGSIIAIDAWQKLAGLAVDPIRAATPKPASF